MSSNKIQMPPVGKLEAWKKQYPDGIHKIEVGDSFCIIRHPSMTDVSMSSALSVNKQGEVDQMVSAQVYLNNCWLYGDESIKTDASKLSAICKAVNSLFQVLPASVEELNSESIAKLDAELQKKLDGQSFVKQISIVDGEKVHTAFFKIPDLEIRGVAKLNSDFLIQGQVFAEQCYLAGDDVLNMRDEVKCALYMAAHRLFRTFDVNLVKL